MVHKKDPCYDYMNCIDKSGNTCFCILCYFFVNRLSHKSDTKENDISYFNKNYKLLFIIVLKQLEL